MAQAKKAGKVGNVKAERQRECLVFANDLFHFILNHPDITRHLPPRITGVAESHFTEHIGKAVTLFWIETKFGFRGLGPFNLKILTSPNMKEEVREAFKFISMDKKNVFKHIVFSCAFFMDMTLFLFQRGFEYLIARLPALWTEIFLTYYSPRFYAKGGWDYFKSYVMDGARKFDSEFRGEKFDWMFDFYAYSNREYKKIDQTKEMRIFIIQKTLEHLGKTRERAMRLESGPEVAMVEVMKIFNMMEKISVLCNSVDTGQENFHNGCQKLRLLVRNFCLEFFDGNELDRFINKLKVSLQQSDEPERPAEATGGREPVETTPGAWQLSATPIPSEMKENVMETLDECVSVIKTMLQVVTPPGTNEEEIEWMTDDDYVKTVIQRIGGMQSLISDPGEKLEEELSRRESLLQNRSQDQMQMVEERIKQLELKEESKAQSQCQSLPKGSSQALNVHSPQASHGGARPKSKAKFPSSETEVSNKEGETSEETKPSTSRNRRRKGSKK